MAKPKLTKLQKHMREIGAKGGQATLKKYGKDHFKKLSKSRWEEEND